MVIGVPIGGVVLVVNFIVESFLVGIIAKVASFASFIAPVLGLVVDILFVTTEVVRLAMRFATQELPDLVTALVLLGQFVGGLVAVQDLRLN